MLHLPTGLVKSQTFTINSLKSAGVMNSKSKSRIDNRYSSIVPALSISNSSFDHPLT